MCHNFRNGNRFQWVARHQREVAEFEGDKMVGARGFEVPNQVRYQAALRPDIETMEVSDDLTRRGCLVVA
jgi:hypothetical protein